MDVDRSFCDIRSFLIGQWSARPIMGDRYRFRAVNAGRLNGMSGPNRYDAPPDAADLKFLHRLRQARLETSNRKAALES
jgi:hypothetical protein